MKVTWVHRNDMLERAVRMVYAHWRKNLEWAEVERWYRRTLPRYAKLTYGSVKDNRASVQRKFLADAIRLAEWRMGV